ncbi:MAG: recombinase family protein [Lachnospiraceae bacterium]|nr:recombinase family protein [Lachnospiraceae bacterium]
MGIRFIAINDHYDSAEQNGDSDHIIIPFKNLINDAYCRDISIKIRSQLDVKRKNGEFIGSFAGYGYLKDPEDKNHLIVDEYAANIVRLVFQWKLDGMSSQHIAAQLDEMGALPPLEYKRMCGLNFNSGFRAGKNPKWSVVSVNRIMRNELYTGVMVQGKRKKITYKLKESHAVDERDWIKVPGTHDAIIPRPVFDQVQKLLELDTRTSPDENTVYLFSGFLQCGGCGQNMVKRCSCKGGKKYHYYHCSTYKNGDGCSSHLISESRLTQAVLAAVQNQVTLLMDAEKIIAAVGQNAQEDYSVKAVDTQLLKLEEEVNRYQDLKARLYEDMQDGVISRDEFKDMNIRFMKQMKASQEKATQMKEKRERLLSEKNQLQPWLEGFREYRSIDHLERKVLTSIVDHITVNGKDNIEIHFRYEDEIKELLQRSEEYKRIGFAGEGKESEA